MRENRTYGLMREGRREPALYSTRFARAHRARRTGNAGITHHAQQRVRKNAINRRVTAKAKSRAIHNSAIASNQSNRVNHNSLPISNISLKRRAINPCRNRLCSRHDLPRAGAVNL